MYAFLMLLSILVIFNGYQDVLIISLIISTGLLDVACRCISFRVRKIPINEKEYLKAEKIVDTIRYIIPPIIKWTIVLIVIRVILIMLVAKGGICNVG